MDSRRVKLSLIPDYVPFFKYFFPVFRIILIKFAK